MAEIASITWDAWRIEVGPPRTHKESIELMRIGRAEIAANPDGIDPGGPFLESLALVGTVSREGQADPDPSDMQAAHDMYDEMLHATPAHAVLTSAANTRTDQIGASRRRMRLNLAATAMGLPLHPVNRACRNIPRWQGPTRASTKRSPTRTARCRWWGARATDTRSRPRRAGPWRRTRWGPVRPEDAVALYARFFNELGIASQLRDAEVEARLPEGLLAPHLAVIGHLSRVGDGRTLHAVAEALQIPRTTASHQVALLRRRRLVRLEPNPRDGRPKIVRLTEAGHGLRADTLAGFADVAERWTRAMPPAMIEGMPPGMERVRGSSGRSKRTSRGPLSTMRP